MGVPMDGEETSTQRRLHVKTLSILVLATFGFSMLFGCSTVGRGRPSSQGSSSRGTASYSADELSPLHISEVCFDNETHLESSPGVFPHWIEIENRGVKNLSLEGLSILIEFPSGCDQRTAKLPKVILGPGELLLFVLSDQEVLFPETAIRVATEFDELPVSITLLDESGDLIDRIELIPSGRDESLVNTGSYLYREKKPTPGISNGIRVPVPNLIVEDDQLWITSIGPEFQVYYTICDESRRDGPFGVEDWVYPTPVSGRLYTGPVLLKSPSVIKARTYTHQGACSDQVEYTHIATDTYSLPVLSLTTDPSSLWSPQWGLFERGGGETANFLENTRVPARITFEDQINERRIDSTSCEIRVYGGYSRWLPQKSIVVYTDGIPDLLSDHTQELGSFILRNAGADSSRTLIRDVLTLDIARSIGIPTQRTRPVVLLLNGHYWGIYFLHDKINGDFIGENGVDLIEGAYSFAMEATEGNLSSVNSLFRVMESLDPMTPGTFAEYERLVDIPAFIDYLILQTYINNTDWPWSNVKFARDRDGTWQFLLYDGDETFDMLEVHTSLYEPSERNPRGCVDFDTLEYLLSDNKYDIVSSLFQQLMKNQTFFDTFRRRYEQLLNTELSYESIGERIDEICSMIEAEMPNHIERWGGSQSVGSMDEWKREVSVIRDFARERQAHVTESLANLENRMATVYGSLLRNGSFEDEDLSMWDLSYTPETVVAEPVKQQGSTHIRISNIGNTRAYWEAVPLVYDSISIGTGDELELCIKTILEQGIPEQTSLRLSLFDCKTNDTVIAFDFTPGDLWQQDSVTFTYEGESLGSVRLALFSGAAPPGTTILVDTISLTAR